MVNRDQNNRNSHMRIVCLLSHVKATDHQWPGFTIPRLLYWSAHPMCPITTTAFVLTERRRGTGRPYLLLEGHTALPLMCHRLEFGHTYLQSATRKGRSWSYLFQAPVYSAETSVVWKIQIPDSATSRVCTVFWMNTPMVTCIHGVHCDVTL